MDKGLGRQLLAKAEEIALAGNKDKIVVISGVGVRKYYEKFGYQRDGPYMGKMLI
jgi:elongator complex protein 3